MRVTKKPAFSFANTIMAHGWFLLAPFDYDEESQVLRYALEIEGRVVDILLKENPGSISIAASSGADEIRGPIIDRVKHMLRMEENFDDLYGIVSGDAGYCWISERLFGPMLRSATVYEDLVKTICTTNCSWGLTKSMVGNLVECLGRKSDSGRRAFPGPESMAAEGDDFYATEIRAGYRGPYLRELAESAASGTVDPESWLDSDLPTAELKKQIKRVKGVGDYAAEHILKLIGRYDGLALDSFLRSNFYETHNDGKPCPDKSIESHYLRFGDWKGLVIWFEMVERAKERRFLEKAARAAL